MMDNDSLAIELLHELKRYSHRNFILFIIALSMFFVSNGIWLYFWYAVPEEVESIEVSQDNNNAGSNNFVGGDYIGNTND